MHTISGNRIAWFLRLQRILRFPKYFLAPPPASLRRSKLVGDDPVSDRTTASGLAQERLVAASAIRGVAPTYQLARTLHGLITSPVASATRAATVAPATDVGRRLTARDAAWIAGPAVGGVGIRQNYVSVAANSKPKYANVPWLAQPSNSVANRPTALRGNRAVGEFAQCSRNAGVWLSRSPTIEPLLTQASRAALPRAPPPPTKEAADLGQPAEANLRSPPDVAMIGPDRGRQGQEAPPASMIHIDGAALGRWAIQHLERALAKPAAGMTGVDPRVSLPRTRVSPF
jgi:hypothetical protein